MHEVVPSVSHPRFGSIFEQNSSNPVETVAQSFIVTMRLLMEKKTPTAAKCCGRLECMQGRLTSVS